MITLQAYWMGRDVKYAASLTAEIKRNGPETVRRVNLLLQLYKEDTGRDVDKVSSGWRPPAVNDETSNAALTSNHLLAAAVDVVDELRQFAAWCVLNPSKLAACGLWVEDPRWTPTWVHLQIVPPRSGKRIYIPSTAPQKAPALSGQKPIPMTVK